MTIEQALETLELLSNDKNCSYEIEIKKSPDEEKYITLEIWSYDYDMYVFSEYSSKLIGLLEDGIKKLEEWEI